MFCCWSGSSQSFLAERAEGEVEEEAVVADVRSGLDTGSARKKKKEK